MSKTACTYLEQGILSFVMEKFESEKEGDEKIIVYNQLCYLFIDYVFEINIACINKNLLIIIIMKFDLKHNYKQRRDIYKVKDAVNPLYSIMLVCNL